MRNVEAYIAAWVAAEERRRACEAQPRTTAPAGRPRTTAGGRARPAGRRSPRPRA